MSDVSSSAESAQIWVDADACPNVIKDILFRAAERTGIDVADSEIVRRANRGDLVITADIPLAALAIEKGALALNPRGELYTADTISQRLSMRNFMDELRGSGVNTGGPPTLNARDRQAFANQLDQWIARRKA